MEVKDFEWNPPKRALAKNVSVAILGKLSQRSVKKKTSIVTCSQEISLIRYNPQYIFLDLHPMLDLLFQCEYELDPVTVAYSQTTQCNFYASILARSRLKVFKDMRFILSLGGIKYIF